MGNMTIDQALAIISQVCANVHGTLKDHQTIQQALQVIEQGAIATPQIEHARARRDPLRDEGEIGSQCLSHQPGSPAGPVATRSKYARTSA